MPRAHACRTSVPFFVLLTLTLAGLAAQAASPDLPPVVRQQLKEKARSASPPPEGLCLSPGGESYTYASPLPAGKVAGARSGGYQVTLGRHLRDGIEVSADDSAMSLRFWPVADALRAAPAAEEGGRLVYRAPGIRYEFSFLKNGLKEDLILETAPSHDLNLLFAFERDGNLEFRLDGKGNVLVYGPDPVLSGFVQTGDDRSAELVMRARRNARKDYLLYLIPAPVVVDADGKHHGGLAHYTLEDNALTLHTADLSALPAPVVVDPSVVVTTSADFRAGNDEGMIRFDTDAISRAAVSGGVVGAWSLAGNHPWYRSAHTSVAYNGYLYVIGGDSGGTALDRVHFAPIGAGGTLGTWSGPFYLPSGRCYHTSVAYNGYLYVIGGYDGSSYLSEVLVAPLQSDGTPGAWSATTSLPTPRRSHASVAYDGYIFVLGGYNSTTGSNNEVRSAAIHADGTVGTWNLAGSFTTARYGHTSVATDGHLYVVGGYNGGQLSDVQFAPIQPGGTVGAFVATTSMPAGRESHTSVVSDGYLYVLGGYGSGALSSVQFAPINSNGTLGPWRAAASFPTARWYHASVVYGGYLYVIGGYGGGSVGLLNDVQVAPVLPVGGVGAWNATASFTNPRRGHTSVAYNGYLYILGGVNGTTYYSDVQYAPIQTDGTVGTWNSTVSFATGRYGHTSVAHNGYLYVVGGYGGSALTTVQLAPINSNGTVGAWSTTTSLPAARYLHSSAVFNGYLYVLGGTSGSSTFSTVWFARLNTDGTIDPGTWQTATSLPSTLRGHASVAYGGYLYALGGWSSTYTASVLLSPIQADGTLGSWSATTGFATARQGHSATVHNGTLYIIGGASSGGSLADVQSAPINPNGTVGAWSATTSLTTARDSHTTAVHGGYLIVAGGWNGSSYYGDVLSASLGTAGAGGALGTWSTTASFPIARAKHASVAYGGYLYVLGGSPLGAPINDVRFAPIHADGTVGPWNAATGFYTERDQIASLAHNGYMYVIGGSYGGGMPDVQFAPIHADGTLGSWGFTQNFSPERYAHAAVVYNGYMYILGGLVLYTCLDDVLFAPIHSDGTVGEWSATQSFSTPRCDHTAFAYDGYMYLLGGRDDMNRFRDVQFAPIHPDGTLGAWSPTTSLPSTRYGHSSLVQNGYAYVLGGVDPAYLDDVEVAPIRPDGTLGGWSPTTSFSGARYQHASVAYDGYLYLTGGYDGSDYLGDVQFASLGVPAARAAYSKLIDLGSDQVVGSLQFDTTGGSGGTVNLTYAFAPESTAVFGARATTGDAPSGAPFAIGPTCGRWMWLRADIDDSESTSMVDGGTQNRTDLLDFVVTYDSLGSVGDTLGAAKTTKVHLAWPAASGATSYNINRCDASAGTCTPTLFDTTANLYYDDTVLGDAHLYWYTVQAVNGECVSD